MEAKQLRHFTVAILQVSIVSDIIVLGSAFLCEVGLENWGPQITNSLFAEVLLLLRREAIPLLTPCKLPQGRA